MSNIIAPTDRITPTNNMQLREFIVRYLAGDISLGNINDWDVSLVVDMSQLFNGYPLFNEPLNNWNVSNVTKMTRMFFRCSAFNQPLNNWNVSNVTSMIDIFGRCTAFNQPLNDWNVSNVTNMSYMFNQCSAFNQPLNNWNVSNVRNMGYMFYRCRAFNQPLTNWNVSTNTNITSVFMNCGISQQNKFVIQRQRQPQQQPQQQPQRQPQDEDDDSDEDDERPQPQPQPQPQPAAVAFEIHHAADKVDLEEYIAIISEGLPEPNYYTTLDNILDYVKPKFIDYIEAHFGIEKDTYKTKLNLLLNKANLATAIKNKPINKIIVGKSVDFVFRQPEEFIDFYIHVFIQDCYHAYKGTGDTSSCVKGIFERFFMIVGDAAFSMCPDEEHCDVPNKEIYLKLLILFNKRADKNAFTQEWAERYLESPEIINMLPEDRKKHYIDFMKSKYREVDLLDKSTEDLIQNEATQLNYVFEGLHFGGGKNKTKRRNNKTKRNKTKRNKTKRNKTKRRNNKTKRNKPI